jgi:hypothetical protein
MHLLSYISIGAIFSHTMVNGHVRGVEKRYKSAPFTPTSCDGKATGTPSLKTCSISGLPNTVEAAITYPPSTTAKTWSTPPATANWQIILDRSINYTFPEVIVDDVKVYDIDLDSSNDTFSSFAAAKKKPGNSEMYLICYFSAGTSEEDRDDVGCFNYHSGAQDYGCNYGKGSTDEFWLNTTSREVRRIMINRLDQAVARGCDAVDPDNMDGYSPDNHSGIGEEVKDAADYMDFLITEAHNRGLAIGLKNSDDLAADDNLVNRLDFAVVEECFHAVDGKNVENACKNWSKFYANETHPKPVYSIEYPIGPDNLGPVDRFPWTTKQAEDRCALWSKEPDNKYLKTNLKNYYKVDCGVARCSSSPVPSLTKTTGFYTATEKHTTYTSTVALQTPPGCVQFPLPTIGT